MRYVWMSLLIVLAAGCSQEEATPPQATASRPPTGEELAHRYLIVDTHIDTPYRLYREPGDVSVPFEGGQFDYPRAKAGGLDVPFMSIYIPASVDEAGNAKTRAEELIDLVEGMVDAHPDKFALAYGTDAVMENFEAGKVSLAMGMENGGPIEGDLANVRYFHDRGIRYITLAHSKSNHIADSSYDDNRQWGGLSDFGKKLVPEMNRVGVMVDVSHISDEAFWDVLEVTKVPVIASHSSARHFVPGFERNMSDEMLKALAENGGVMQLNIGSSFVSKASRESSDRRSDLLQAYLEENDIEPDSDAGRAAREKIWSENPYVYADLDDVLDHVDHVVGLVGIDHIGIGSDFDGVGDTLPKGFKDVSDYPNFIDGLLERGYSESDIEKILGGNLMRVWREVEGFAAHQMMKKSVR